MKVIIRPVQPVLPDRAEHVELERVVQRLGLVRHRRRDVQHLAFADDELLAADGEPAGRPGRRSVICSLSWSCIGTMAPFLSQIWASISRSPVTILREIISVTFSGGDFVPAVLADDGGWTCSCAPARRRSGRPRRGMAGPLEAGL
ncbi:MAG: hypothetical protein MZU84_04050 [Sphingobacterium sp.]|nr:hypothetical protein [Sphingobacterium sp.]